jgi:hypothetical protein
MAQIRQEINIINSAYTSTGGLDLGGVIQIDTLKFYSASTFYFDLVASGSASNTGKVTLRQYNTTTDSAVIQIGATTGKQLFRTSFSAPYTSGAGANPQQFFVHMSGDNTHAQTVYSAKVNIIQNGPQIKSTISNFEIGGQFTTGSTTYVPLQYPKYFYYDATKYSGSNVSGLFEVTLSCSGSSGGVLARLEYAPTPNSFSGWTPVPNMEVTATTSAQTLYLPTSRYYFFTLTSNTYYRVAVRTTGATNPVTISNAKVALWMNDGSSIHVPFFGKNIFGYTGGTYGQQFRTVQPMLLTGVKVNIGSVNNPTDQLAFCVVPSLPTAPGIPSNTVAYGTISGATLNSNGSGTLLTYLINMTQPAAISAGTWFCIAIRVPDLANSTNYYNWEEESYQIASYAYGGFVNQTSSTTAYTWNYGSNSGIGNNNMYLELVGSPGISNYQSELLITNTLLSAGTSPQQAYTNFNTTDWFNVQNTYSFLIDSASASTSNVSLITTGGTLIVTGQPANEIYITGFTMPYLANVLDISATTNNNDIYATKLLINNTINLQKPSTPSVGPFFL